MVYSSISGLLPAQKKSIKNSETKLELRSFEFQNCISIRPAKFTLKPYSSIINPYQNCCSILCNHPTTNSTEIPRGIKKNNKIKNDLIECGVDKKVLVERVGEVLEEMLLSRYRREEIAGDLIAPSSDDFDEYSTTGDEQIYQQPRAVLYVDLRRPASQETITTKEGSGADNNKTPGISPSAASSASAASQTLFSTVKEPSTQQIKDETSLSEVPTDEHNIIKEDESDDIHNKRRGKIRKKKKATKSITIVTDDRGSKEVVGLIEPGETQVSTYQETVDDYRSSCPTTPVHNKVQIKNNDGQVNNHHHHLQQQQSERLLPISDLFDENTLLHLRRSVTLNDAEAHPRTIK